MLIYGTVCRPGQMHDGAFIVLNTKNNSAGYCYPSSQFADDAKKDAGKTARAMYAADQLHCQQFATCARLLQYCDVCGHSGLMSYGDSDSIVYDLEGTELLALSRHCTFSCKWTNAIERVTGKLPQVWSKDV